MELITVRENNPTAGKYSNDGAFSKAWGEFMIITQSEADKREMQDASMPDMTTAATNVSQHDLNTCAVKLIRIAHPINIDVRIDNAKSEIRIDGILTEYSSNDSTFDVKMRLRKSY